MPALFAVALIGPVATLAVRPQYRRDEAEARG